MFFIEKLLWEAIFLVKGTVEIGTKFWINNLFPFCVGNRDVFTLPQLPV